MVPVRNLVPESVARLLRPQPLTEAKVAFAWRMAVGPALERASRVTLSEAGVLRVVAQGEHWRREIERSRPLIVARLERLLGRNTVRRIVVEAAPTR